MATPEKKKPTSATPTVSLPPVLPNPSSTSTPTPKPTATARPKASYGTPPASSTPTPKPKPSVTGAASTGSGPSTSGGYGNPGGAFSPGADVNTGNDGTVNTGTVTDPNTGVSVPAASTIPFNTKNGVEYKTIGGILQESRNPKNLAKIKSALINAGVLSKTSKSITSVQNAWIQVLIGAQSSRMDPYEYMQQLKGAGFGQDIAQQTPIIPTTNISSPTEAADAIDKAFKNLLGRDPSAKEVQDLTKSLNAAQKLNPTKGEYINGTLQYSGGLNADQFLEENIKALPEYQKKFQAAVGNDLTKVLNTAMNNGLVVTDSQKQAWSDRIAKGEDPTTLVNEVRNMASFGYPENIKKLMEAGNDLGTILSPYKQYMSSVLEVDPNTISMNDPALRMAIGPQGEMTLYDYQNALRKDNRWQYTNNAKETVANAVTQVLNDFGFKG